MTDVADHLAEYEIKDLSNQNILQYVIDHIQSGDINLFDYLKWYLKNVKNVYKGDYTDQNNLINALKQSAIASTEWISSNNFFDWMQYRSITCIPFEGVDYGSLRPSIVVDYTNFKENLEITDEYYYDLVLKPFYNGFLYILSAIGLVDIASDPSDQYLDMKPSSSLEPRVFIPFKSLKFFKVNDLGRFVLGLTKEYKSKSNSSYEPLIFTLETDYPGIQFSRPDQALSSLLKEYALIISPTMMVVNRSTFLNKVTTKKDLEDKIQSFYRIVNQKFPPNWKIFFRSLEIGFHPLKKDIDNFYIYTVPETNQEIVDLLTYDVSIRNIIIRAEGHRILIREKDHAKFVSRMKEKGWVV